MIKAGDYLKHNLNELVVSYIKDKILSGELKSGDKLIETDISNDLQISRAPLREALRELNASGLISFSPRRGNQVVSLTRKEIREIFEIRIALELQIFHILITNKPLSEANFEHLSKLSERMKDSENLKLEKEEKLFLLNSQDIAFHGYLWEQSGSVRRRRYLESLFYQLLIAMNADTVTLGTFRDKAREHEKITEALKSGDGRKVRREFTNHLRQYMSLSVPEFDTDCPYVFCGLDS